MISCDYLEGCDKTGCSYNLTSTNDSLTGKIQGSTFSRIEVQKYLYNLTVTKDGVIVQSEELNFSDVNSCTTITG